VEPKEEVLSRNKRILKENKMYKTLSKEEKLKLLERRKSERPLSSGENKYIDLQIKKVRKM
jgi:hypothetical protein